MVHRMATFAWVGVLAAGLAGCILQPNQYSAESTELLPDAGPGRGPGTAEPGPAQPDGGAGAPPAGDGPSPSTPNDPDPVPPVAGVDASTSAVCGNGVLEPGEECEGNCPASCTNRGCTKFDLQGSPAQCTARCVEMGVETACKNGDGCCPPGCNTAIDGDCSVQCGNELREAGETCDPLASCPTSCPTVDCQLRKLINPGTCAAECVNDRQLSGCCTNDSQCPGNFACQNKTCSGTCIAGHKLCNGSCIPNRECCGSCSGDVCQNDDVFERFCNNGTCATRMNRDCGNFRCDGESCSSQCRSGFKECNGSCIPNNQCCGGCPGSFCQDDDAFERFCNNGTCDSRRTRDCGNFRCSGGSCSNQCRDGLKSCDGNCIPESSCCGGCSGTVCQNDDEFVRFCDNGTCRTQFSTDCAPFGCSGTTCRTSCSGRTVLQDGRCVPCGGREQPCCRSGDACNSPNDGCRTTRGFFPPPKLNTCGECGFRDAPCCAGNTCTDDFNQCNGGVCG